MITHFAQQVRTGAAYMLVTAVRFYQACFRPLFPSVCRFYPSCSEYFIQAVQKHGPMKGTGLGVWRCCRCNPLSAGGYDPP